MLLDLSYRDKFHRRTLKHELKVLNAAQLHVHVTNDIGLIAQAVDVSVERLIHWQTTATWQEAVDFWNGSGDYAKPQPLVKKRCNLSARRRRAIKPALYDKQDGFCNGCERFFDMNSMTIDHIQPRSQGGSNRRENLQLLCQTCNTLKSDGTQQEFIEKLQADGRLHRRSGLSRFFARAFYAGLSFVLSLYMYH